MWPRDPPSTEETNSGTVIAIVLSLISMGALSFCLSKYLSSLLWSLALFWWTHLARRVQNVHEWRRLPIVCWSKFLTLCQYCVYPKPVRSCFAHILWLDHFRFRYCHPVEWIWSGFFQGDVRESDIALFGVLYDHKGKYSHPTSIWVFLTPDRWCVLTLSLGINQVLADDPAHLLLSRGKSGKSLCPFSMTAN